MLVAISMLRTSGTFDVIINGIKELFAAMGADTRFVDGLPTAFIKPLSGSGARGMMLDTMKTFGADFFAGRLSPFSRVLLILLFMWLQCILVR